MPQGAEGGKRTGPPGHLRTTPQAQRAPRGQVRVKWMLSGWQHAHYFQRCQHAQQPKGQRGAGVGNAMPQGAEGGKHPGPHGHSRAIP